MEHLDISLLVNIVTILGGIWAICKMLIGPIDKRIDRLETGQDSLKTGQAKLEVGQAKLETELKNIKELIQLVLKQNGKNKT